MKRALALITLGILLSGCGQKGPLYMPEPESLDSTQVPAQQQETDAKAMTDVSIHSQGGVGG